MPIGRGGSIPQKGIEQLEDFLSPGLITHRIAESPWETTRLICVFKTSLPLRKRLTFAQTQIALAGFALS